MSLLKDKISAMETREAELVAEGEKSAKLVASMTDELAKVTTAAQTEALAQAGKIGELAAQVKDLTDKLAEAQTALATATADNARKTAALANPAFIDAAAGTQAVSAGDAKEGATTDRDELAKQLAAITDPAKRQAFFLANFCGK